MYDVIWKGAYKTFTGTTQNVNKQVRTVGKYQGSWESKQTPSKGVAHSLHTDSNTRGDEFDLVTPKTREIPGKPAKKGV